MHHTDGVGDGGRGVLDVQVKKREPLGEDATHDCRDVVHRFVWGGDSVHVDGVVITRQGVYVKRGADEAPKVPEDGGRLDANPTMHRLARSIQRHDDFIITIPCLVDVVVHPQDAHQCQHLPPILKTTLDASQQRRRFCAHQGVALYDIAYTLSVYVTPKRLDHGDDPLEIDYMTDC